MHFVFTESSLKDLSRFPKDIQTRILSKLDWFETQSDPLSFAEPLQGYSHLFRFRIGNYRVVVKREKQNLFIMLIDKRDKAYRHK